MMTAAQLRNASDPGSFGDGILPLLFDVGLKQGLGRFNSAQRAVYLCMDLYIDLDMNGLSAYFYNRLPERYQQIIQTIQALRTVGAVMTATALEQPVALFADYQDPAEPSTWGTVRAQYDPGDRLSELEDVIHAARSENITSYLWENREALLQGIG